MGLEDGVHEVCVVPLGVGDRVAQPAVVGLTGDLEYPVRHRDGDPVSGKFRDERVDHFPGRFAWDR